MCICVALFAEQQSDEWRPELIAQEAAAKERASCLLFVFQPHLTRGLASLVEVAYVAARPQLYNRSNFCRRSRLLLIVRPPLSSNPALCSPTVFHATPAWVPLLSLSTIIAASFFIFLSPSSREAASIKAAYQWLEGLQFPHVRFFERLEDALFYIKTLYQCHRVGCFHASPYPSSLILWLEFTNFHTLFGFLSENRQGATVSRSFKQVSYSCLNAVCPFHVCMWSVNLSLPTFVPLLGKVRRGVKKWGCYSLLLHLKSQPCK